MIDYLHSSEIEREKWDRCISGSLSDIVYGYSWYLDIVSPGWCGLIEGDYLSVMPLPVKKKFGIHYIIQPVFTQQLGIFSSLPFDAESADQFFRSIPPLYRFVDINLNFSNYLNDLPFSFSVCSNFELCLNSSSDMLWSDFSQNTKRNVRKSMEGMVFSEKVPVDEHIHLLKTNPGAIPGFRNWHWLREFITGIIQRGPGGIWGVYHHGKLCVSVFLIHFAGRIYYLIPVSDETGRTKMAMFALVSHIIEKHAGQDLVLDFEGSNLEGVARFYRGFGARELIFPRIRINRLPFFLKFLAGK